MKESVLQYVWQFRRYNSSDLITTAGLPITVIHPGKLNTDSGPDFLNAKIKIGDVEWRGHVEIHVRSSEWLQHGHQNDRKYDNVILHVVYEDDLVGGLPKNIPVLELSARVSLKLLRTYRQWQTESSSIPCGNKCVAVDETTWTLWKERMVAERLETKYLLWQDLLAKHGGDIEVATWHLLARYLFTPQNRASVDVLFAGFDWHCLWKMKDSLPRIEAVLFGQAGFLQEKAIDDYTKQLKREYSYQKKKLGLIPMPAFMWHFLRMRPGAFPTVRLALLASIVHHAEHLFQTITDDPEGFVNRLGKFDLSNYWAEHYHLGKKAGKPVTLFGKEMRASLIANVAAPLVFARSRIADRPDMTELAVSLLRKYPAEHNHKTGQWESLGINAHNLFDSQALIQLHDQYCLRKQCLKCVIAHKILGRDLGTASEQMVGEEEFFYA